MFRSGNQIFTLIKFCNAKLVYIWGTSKEFTKFKQKVLSVYTTKQLQRKAYEVGFYKRSSKLLPSQFFDILLYAASINGPCSLVRSSCEIAQNHGISISKQGLDDRFNDTAVAFMRSIFEEQLSKQIQGTVNAGFLRKFSRVRIKDATRFDLPKRLKDYFPGFGGKLTSEAAGCIQCEFDIKTNKILDISFTSAKRTDYEDAREKMMDIEKNDLIIRDLGYFSTDVIKHIIKQKAYYISRLHSKILIYHTDKKTELFFSDLYNSMQKKKQTHTELQVCIGKDEKLPVRLIIDLMPDEVYKNRLLKAEKEARKKGHQVSMEFKARAHFNLLITNIPDEITPSEQVYQLYKIRWQIELIFKIWKSTYGINKLHPMRYERFMCLLYSKFIMILINTQLINLLQPRLYRKHRKLLSKDKCFKTLSIYFHRTRQVLFNPGYHLVNYLKTISIILSQNHWLEKRKKRLSYVDIFTLNICLSNY